MEISVSSSVAAPAQQREVVAHRLGQVAGVAQLLHRGGPVALGELLAVGPVQQRQVGVDRRLRAERLEHEQLLGGVGEVVLAAHDVGDLRVEVVDGDGEVVEDACRPRGRSPGRRGGRAANVVSPRIRSWTTVSPSSGTRSRTAPSRLGLAAEAAIGAVALLVGLDVVGRRGGAVGVARRPAAGRATSWWRSERDDLRDRALVPVELEPAQRVEDLLDVLGRRALAVGVLDAQDQRPARARGPSASCRAPCGRRRCAGRRSAKERSGLASPLTLG